jgi:hypothetical protein
MVIKKGYMAGHKKWNHTQKIKTYRTDFKNPKKEKSNHGVSSNALGQPIRSMPKLSSLSSADKLLIKSTSPRKKLGVTTPPLSHNKRPLNNASINKLGLYWPKNIK